MKPKSGFTLVEVLIVLILLFFLAFSTFTSIRATFRNKEDIDKRTEYLQEGRAVLAILTRDIRLAYLVRPVDFGWFPIKKMPDGSGDAPPAVTPPVVTIFQGKSNEIFFSARSHLRTLEDSAENESHFVTYQLGSGDSLIRAESKRAVSVKDRESPDQFSKQVLLEGIKTFKLEYFNPLTEKWEDSWDSEKGDMEGALPETVRLELEYLPKLPETARSKPKNVFIKTHIRILETVFRDWSYKNELPAPLNTNGNPASVDPDEPPGGG